MKRYYREFTCFVCGEKGIDRGIRQNAKYCSTRCRNYANRKGIKIEIENLCMCMHNEGVLCTIHQCEGCGWNPAVQQARVEKLMGV